MLLDMRAQETDNEQHLAELSAFVKEVWTRSGLTLTEIHRRGGPAPSLVSDLASGKKLEIPKRSTLAKLARGLGIPLRELLIKAGQMEGVVAAPEMRRELADFIHRTRGRMPIYDLARIASVPPELFDQIDAGHVPPPATLKKIAAALGVSVEDINAAARPTRASKPDDLMDAELYARKVPMPYYGKVGCGDFLELDGEAIDRVDVPEAYLQEGDFDAMRVLRADGNSMNLAEIEHGMFMLVDTSTEPRSGDVVIATAPIVGTTCKKLEKRPDGFYLVPDSTERHPTIKVTEEVRIQGVVLEAWARVSFRRKR